MAAVRNILFIMCDQLRADYLSCAGHPTLKTPNIDALAARGVRFERAYCQAPLCGPSRMSFYTGRYVSSHGSTVNNVPLPVSEWTLGDYLRPLGLRVAVVGKTHMKADVEGFARIGLDPQSPEGILARECGFEPFARDDGLHPGSAPAELGPYNRYLRAKGYPGPNPWHDFANAADGPDGQILSGWHMRNAHLPARIPEADSETAYCTRRAMDFIEECGERPWCLHLSYIKPHWPYMAPSPYHRRYGEDDIAPANRSDRERAHPHPVVGAFMHHDDSRTFQDDAVRRRVIPAYMGLVAQIDDHVGRLMEFLAQQRRLDDTLIVFTSDHGDYLGDHWLGEKELFHDEAVRIPCIVVDPDARAAHRRGSVDRRLVEAIDLVPTFVAAVGENRFGHRLEGRSILPLMRGATDTPAWRETAFSETDYAHRAARERLGCSVDSARAYMVRTARWKYVFYEGFPAQLFDMENDPREQNDLGAAAAFAAVASEHREMLFSWMRHLRTRTTLASEALVDRHRKVRERGILIGVW